MWEPRLVPLYFQNADGEYVVDEGAQRVERDDTGAKIGTSAVSGTFELISHAEMGYIVEPLLEQGAKIDTMGSVKDGAQVYATLLLDEPYTIPGDVDGFGDPVLTLPYLAVLNSHDGTGACKALRTQVRVVCANTVQAASLDGDRHGAQFSLRHTSGVAERIESARETIQGLRADVERWKEIATALAVIPVTDAQQLQYLSEFIPEPPAGVTTDRVKGNIERDRQRFLHVLRQSATNCEMQHNALGLFNACVEYLDHLRGFRNQDTYLGRQILSAEPLKARSLTLIRDLVGAS